jgi:hypothetical protein
VTPSLASPPLTPETFVFLEQVFYSSASLELRPCHNWDICVSATRAESREIPATQQEVVYG